MWIRYFSKSKQTYYWIQNTNSETKTFEKPDEIKKKEKKLNVSTFWEEKVSMKKNNGKKYWVNTHTGEYSWCDPKDFSSEYTEPKSTETSNGSDQEEDIVTCFNNMNLNKKNENHENHEKEKDSSSTKTVSDVVSESTSCHGISRSSYQDRDSYPEYRSYTVTNGAHSLEIRATDRYEAMEELQALNQSMNPYD